MQGSPRDRKKHFEFFKGYMTNKKHKGIKKGSKGMEFANYTNRIKPLRSFDTFEKQIIGYKKVSRFMGKKGEMVTTSVVKAKFSQINDKRFYFPNGLPPLSPPPPPPSHNMDIVL